MSLVNTPEPTVHVMVDIETLDTTPDAVILSLGACTIQEPHAYWYDEFDESTQFERSVSKETLHWWETQAGTPMPKGNTGLTSGLEAFTKWLEAFKATPIIWAKGIDFDCVILAHAFRQCGLKLPWKYNSVRDFRTVKKTMPVGGDLDFSGLTPHNAMHDAMRQAAQLRQIAETYTRSFFLS
jgi:hypothetical protein